jgi:hypothetical protein
VIETAGGPRGPVVDGEVVVLAVTVVDVVDDSELGTAGTCGTVDADVVVPAV